jgi:head-tail adaptor
MIYNQTVVRVRANTSTKDPQGNTITSWDDAERVTYANVAVQPMTSQEAAFSADARDQVFTNYRVSTRRHQDMDVTVYDRIEWAGQQWSVSETPQRWPDSQRPGKVHHVTVPILLMES